MSIGQTVQDKLATKLQNMSNWNSDADMPVIFVHVMPKKYQ